MDLANHRGTLVESTLHARVLGVGIDGSRAYTVASSRLDVVHGMVRGVRVGLARVVFVANSQIAV